MIVGQTGEILQPLHRQDQEVVESLRIFILNKMLNAAFGFGHLDWIRIRFEHPDLASISRVAQMLN